MKQTMQCAVREAVIGAAVLAGFCSTVAAQQSTTALRSLYRQHDSQALTRAIEQAATAQPEDARLAAWSAVFGRRGNALKVAAKLRKAEKSTPWALLAACAVDNGWAARADCEKALAAAPVDPDVLLLAVKAMTQKLYTAESPEQTALFAHELTALLTAQQSALDGSADGLVLHAEALTAMTHLQQGDSTRQQAELLDRALKLEPAHARAVLLKAELLATENKAGAAALLADAARHSDSRALHLAYWRAALDLPAKGGADNMTAIVADARAYFTQHKPDENTTQTVMGELSATTSLERAIGAVIGQIAPQTAAADMAQYWLILIDDPRMTEDQNEPIQTTALEAFLARPKHLSKSADEMANQTLSYMLGHATPLDGARLFQVLQALNGDSTSAIEALAKAKLHLPELERMADHQLDAQWKILQERALDQTDKDGFLDFELSEVVAPWQSTLALVYLQEGKLKEAEQKLDTSLSLWPENADSAVLLGKVYAAEGDGTKAEAQYRKALAMPFYRSGEHVAVQALREQYLQTHPGDATGLAAYLAPLLAQDRDRRKSAVLAKKLLAPPPVPEFQLHTLDGKTIASSDLKGKTVVLNFWATWCGPCRRELPDFEKLYQKYKNDPKVVVLSMSTDEASTPVQSIADFVQGHRYSFPVLLGGDFAAKHSIAPIPMTWFINPEGRKVFEKIGYTKELEEEFDWRIEAIQKEAAK